MSSTGKASTSGFDDLDGNNLTFVGEGRVTTNFFGLTGHQLLGAVFSNRNFSSLDQNARFIFENGALEGKKGSWNVYYNFDQYLYEPKKGSGEGIGVFGRFGASDGNPNFMHFFYSLGIGGKGVIPTRHNDRYGFGFYYIDVSNPKLQGFFRTTKLLRDEYGFEAFYNIAVTPWLMLTPDVQVVRGAQKKTSPSARWEYVRQPKKHRHGDNFRPANEDGVLTRVEGRVSREEGTSNVKRTSHRPCLFSESLP